MLYEIMQNPEYGIRKRKVKPFYVYQNYSFIGRRNFAGLFIIKGHKTIIKSNMFTNKNLLERLKENLDKRNIEYKVI